MKEYNVLKYAGYFINVFPYFIYLYIINAYNKINYSPALKKWGLYWICPVLPSICHSVILSFLNLQNENVLSHFSRELWGLEGRNLVHTWTLGGYIVYTRIRLLLLILPFISSIFFLSNFQTLKCFVTLFSVTMRPRRLKLGTHMDNGWMYRVYRIQSAAAYSSLYFFSFISLQFSNVKYFRHTFLRNCRRLKLGTHMDSGWVYRVYRNQAAAAYSSLYFFIFLPPIFKH